MAIVAVIADQVLNVPYHFGATIPLAGLLSGAIGVAIAGLIGTRSAVTSPPLQTLRALG